MDHKTSLLLLTFLLCLGCGQKSGKAPRFELEKSSLAQGEAPVVRYKAPVPVTFGQQYWITLVEVSSPDSAWGTYAYLVPGSMAQTLAVPGQGRGWEVRLHDLYPQHSFKVIQRQVLKVEGVPAGEAPAAPSGTGPTASAPLPSANSDTTKYGSVQAEVKTMLTMRQAARDGGTFYETQAAAGKKFLVLSFPETQRRKEQVIYEDSKVRLLLEGGVELESHSAATGGVNNEAALQRGDPPRFETEIWMSTINEANAYPFALAFEVPDGSHRAWLRVEDRTLEIAF